MEITGIKVKNALLQTVHWQKQPRELGIVGEDWNSNVRGDPSVNVVFLIQ